MMNIATKRELQRTKTLRTSHWFTRWLRYASQIEQSPLRVQQLLQDAAFLLGIQSVSVRAQRRTEEWGALWAVLADLMNDPATTCQTCLAWLPQFEAADKAFAETHPGLMTPTLVDTIETFLATLPCESPPVVH